MVSLPSSATPPCALSIAGSDSGGGAGIQADLKAFARCGVHGMTAITAITAQNTLAVRSVQEVPPAVVIDQVRAVVEDIGVDAVKIGMLGTAATIEAVDRALDLVGDAPVVLDPVMVAESGAVLLDEGAQEELRSRLVARAAVITPNLAEARALVGEAGAATADRREGAGESSAGKEVTEVEQDDEEQAEVERLARSLHELGPEVVVITGGHRRDVSDVFFDGVRLATIPGERHPDGAAHGSGCTHSSALAAHLALGLEPLEAARRARVIAGAAVRDGLRGVGSGAGPVDALGIRRRRGARAAVDPPRSALT